VQRKAQVAEGASGERLTNRGGRECEWAMARVGKPKELRKVQVQVVEDGASGGRLTSGGGRRE